jgi:RNA polymerase sigma-70 factor (ECF subfamily)
MNAYAIWDDKQLLAHLQAGNEQAFTELYNRYWQKLFSIAANKLNNLAEAEELVQDIFLEIWNRRAELNITSSLSAYLAVSVKYKVINVLAKRNKQNQYYKFASQNTSNCDLSTENWLSFEELKERLSKLVAALPEKCRLVYQLSREHGLSQKEISAELSISEKTVESHLSKALRSLRLNLGHFLHVFLTAFVNY